MQKMLNNKFAFLRKINSRLSYIGDESDNKIEKKIHD